MLKKNFLQIKYFNSLLTNETSDRQKESLRTEERRISRLERASERALKV